MMPGSWRELTGGREERERERERERAAKDCTTITTGAQSVLFFPRLAALAAPITRARAAPRASRAWTAWRTAAATRPPGCPSTINLHSGPVLSPSTARRSSVLLYPFRRVSNVGVSWLSTRQPRGSPGCRTRVCVAQKDGGRNRGSILRWVAPLRKSASAGSTGGGKKKKKGLLVIHVGRCGWRDGAGRYGQWVAGARLAAGGGRGWGASTGTVTVQGDGKCRQRPVPSSPPPGSAVEAAAVQSVRQQTIPKHDLPGCWSSITGPHDGICGHHVIHCA